MQTDALVLQQIPAPSVPVTRAADATPFVRRLTRALKLNAWSTTGQDSLSGFTGTVGVVTSSGRQCATISRSDDEILVRHGVPSPEMPVVLVDRITMRPTKNEPSCPESVQITRLINPALPRWQALLPAFRSATAELPGLPPILLVDTTTGETERVGDSSTAYEVHGPTEALQRFVAGLEFFPDAVYGGKLLIRGSFSGFSSVTGASMKVMFDV